MTTRESREKIELNDKFAVRLFTFRRTVIPIHHD